MDVLVLLAVFVVLLGVSWFSLMHLFGDLVFFKKFFRAAEASEASYGVGVRRFLISFFSPQNDLGRGFLVAYCRVLFCFFGFSVGRCFMCFLAVLGFFLAFPYCADLQFSGKVFHAAEASEASYGVGARRFLKFFFQPQNDVWIGFLVVHGCLLLRLSGCSLGRCFACFVVTISFVFSLTFVACVFLNEVVDRVLKVFHMIALPVPY